MKYRLFVVKGWLPVFNYPPGGYRPEFESLEEAQAEALRCVDDPRTQVVVAVVAGCASNVEGTPQWKALA